MPRKEEQNQTVTQLSGYQLQATDRQTDRLTVLLEEKHQRIITDLYCSGLRVSYHYYITVRWHHLYGVCRSKYYHLWEPTALFVIILKIKFSLTWPKQLYMAAASMVYLFYTLRPWGVTITFYPQNRINKIYSRKRHQSKEIFLSILRLLKYYLLDFLPSWPTNLVPS